MGDFTRLTLANGARRVDVVVASDQPLGGLMPRLVDVLGVPAADGPQTLVRPIGDSLDLGLDCAGNQLLDGEIVYMVPLTRAPAPPTVSDVTDLVAGARALAPGAWNARSLHAVSAAFVAVQAALVGWYLPWGSVPGTWRWPVLAIAVLVLAGVAVAMGRTGHQWGCSVAAATAGGLSVPAAMLLARAALVADKPALGVGAGIVLACLGAGAGVGIGLGRRWVQVSAGLSGGIALIGVGLMLGGVRTDQAWGLAAVVGAVAVGLVPAWATTISGLSGLDDFAATGEPVARDRVLNATSTAYRIMTWAVVGLAIVTGVAGVWAAAWHNPWGMGLAAIVALVLALRARTLPQTVQVVSLWMAVLAVGSAIIMGLGPWYRFAALMVAGIVAIGAVVPIPVHVRIRARRIGDLVAKIAVALMLPALLGLFGVYTWLLGAFG